MVFTGGTISMRVDAVEGVAVPALSGPELLSLAPEAAGLAEIEPVDFARMPGWHVTPERMWELSELVNLHLEREEISGVVITHGTDTIEETAFLLDLRLTSPKPVVLVGALRNSSDAGWDGPANILAAVRTAVDPGARGRGALVVLNDTIHAASEVVKAHTHALDAFRSPTFGPLGVVEKDGLHWRRALTGRRTIPGFRIETDVELFTMAAGVCGRAIEHAVAAGTQGIVLEGTGRGNVPPAAVAAIQHALDAGIPVIMTSRCGEGRVLDVYGGPGSARDLRSRGVILGGSLAGPKARILLMTILGSTRDPVRIKEIVEQGA